LSCVICLLEEAIHTIINSTGGKSLKMTDSKQQSNPFSTGGGGTIFETRVQAAFVVLMLTGQIAPCLPPWPITKIKLQGRYAGFNTDDFIVFAKDIQTEKEAKLLAQIKHSISITEGNDVFGEVIQAAWNDFRNPDIFTAGNDVFALITGPLSATDINNTRTLLEWARHSDDAKEFFHKVNLANFSNDAKREKLKVFQTHLNKANDGNDISDEQFWEFLKSFYLIGYDLDTESGITLSLLRSLIAQSATGDAPSLWSRVVDAVQSYNQTAGTVTLGILPTDIINAFHNRQNTHFISDVNRLRDHGDYIINGIRKNIAGVHINRSDFFDQLLEISEGAEFVFLLGERGCGKSSLVKEFDEYIGDRVPVFCLRTEDLDRAHLDNVFSAIGLTSSISDLEAGFAMMPKKYLLIESLEKLLELQNTAAFTDLIYFITKHPGWTIIASGRDYAYQQITLHFLQPTGIHYSSLLIKDFSDDDVEYLCKSIELLQPLSNNESIKALLKKPYYAELAYRIAQTGTQFSSGDGEKEFQIAVWRDVISKEHIRANGMPLRRKQTFIDIALKRAKQMVYGVSEVRFDPDALLRLEEDNLIYRDKSNGLVSPAHDVLEDWALERYIEEVSQTNTDNIKGFLNAVGYEPAMNRAFRLWLHQKIRFGENVAHLVLNILNDENIKSCWQDETISAILLSNTSYEFITSLKEQLLGNDGKLLKRFCFILRIACKTLDLEIIKLLSDNQTSQASDILYLKPYGSGWEDIILFLFENKDSISPQLISHISAVLYDWSSMVHIEKELPSPAREAGLLAMYLLNMVKDYRDEGYRKNLITVIIKVVPAIFNEFKDLMEADIFRTDNDGRRLPYVKYFCVMALTGIETVYLCKNAPDIVIKLAFHEWLIDESKEDRHHSYSYRKEVEECFGLYPFREASQFFPPSGAKGPFSQLLRFSSRKGLDFILELLNITAKKYAHSDLDSPGRYSLPIFNINQSGVEKVEIRLNDGTNVKQFCSSRLWLGYRSHSVIPCLLQSALMALENWLINKVKYSNSEEELEWIFDYILRNSNSVMPTAVLASVATGYPDKVGKLALPILRVPEFYNYDLERTVHERGGNEIDWHKTGFNREPLADIYSEERRLAALRSWRKEHLEDLIVRLQFSDLRNEALTVIDELRHEAPNEEKWHFRFHRIDSRGWKPELDNDNNRIIFTNENLEPDLEEIQKKTQEDMALTNRFSAMFLWSEKTFKGEALESVYYANWNDALTEAKNLFEIVTSGNANDLLRMQFGSVIKAAAIFLRDHSKELKEDDLSWCIQLVVETVLADADTNDSITIADKTDLDGAAASALVLPILFNFADEDNDRVTIKRIIATALTHANENVRIGTANGINKYLWQVDPDFAQSCFIGGIEYARLKLEESKKAGFWEYSDDEEIGESYLSEAWLEHFREQLASEEVTANIENISFNSHSSWHILSPCLMIPDGSIESTHIALLSRMLDLIFEAEESNSRDYPEKKIRISDELPMNFSKKLAEHLLNISDIDAPIFVEQLRNGCDTAPDFIHWLLLYLELVTEKMGKKELYWKFWAKLSEKVQEIAISIQNQSRYSSDDKVKLIRSMLHADTPWQKVDYENEDIALGKDLILEFVNNAGENPDVFGAMASLISHFPTIFLNPGLLILSKHQKKAGGTKLLSRVNTAFYLERCIQRLLLHDNTGPLPRDLHESCSVLLDAIIETASSGAYFLREHLIRSHRVMN